LVLKKNAHSLAKPSALIGDPPAQNEQRQRERQTPQEGQGKVHYGAKDNEEHPEDFLFHVKTKPYHG
jgi:hypothetical protein